MFPRRTSRKFEPLYRRCIGQRGKICSSPKSRLLGPKDTTRFGYLYTMLLSLRKKLVTSCCPNPLGISVPSSMMKVMHCVHDGPWQPTNGHARACTEQRMRWVFSDIVHQTWSWESWWNQIHFQSIYFVTLQVYQPLVWYYFVNYMGDYPCFNLKASNSWWPSEKLHLHLLEKAMYRFYC